jgi:hypothetical protein
MTKNCGISHLKKSFLKLKIAIYLPLGLHEEKSNLPPSKENIQHFKT